MKNAIIEDLTKIFKIEKLKNKIVNHPQYQDVVYERPSNDRELQDKINEIIDVINELIQNNDFIK